jgi:hypothetical protein
MMQYKVGDMVFAKCQNYPFWPGKVILVYTIAGSYKVLFYGEKSEATIDESCMLPFSDDIIRKVMNEGANKNNKDLRHSIQIACKRFQKRKKGLASSSEEDDFIQESDPPKREPQEIQKQKRIVHYKTPEDPHLELSFLLNNLGNEAATFSQSKVRGIKFTPENEARLRQLIDPNFGLSIALLIDFKVIEKFIIVLKELDMWGLKVYGDLPKLIRERYEEYKAFILSEEFAGVALREVRRDIITQKVTHNRAVL